MVVVVMHDAVVFWIALSVFMGFGVVESGFE